MNCKSKSNGWRGPVSRGQPTMVPPRRLQPNRAKPHRAAQHAGYCTVDPGVVFADLLPDLTESNNGFAWACCPFHNDHNPSLSVNLNTGWYRCFSSACGVTGRNIVSFVSALVGLEPGAARRHVEARYGR